MGIRISSDRLLSTSSHVPVRSNCRSEGPLPERSCDRRIERPTLSTAYVRSKYPLAALPRKACKTGIMEPLQDRYKMLVTLTHQEVETDAERPVQAARLLQLMACLDALSCSENNDSTRAFQFQYLQNAHSRCLQDTLSGGTDGQDVNCDWSSKTASSLFNVDRYKTMESHRHLFTSQVGFIVILWQHQALH